MGRFNLRAVYFGLVVLRLCFALFGTGYIHPDEWFQNGEAVAGRTLGLHTQLTWEWEPVFPCRSIVPVWLTTGVPFWLAQRLTTGDVLNPRILFVAERLSSFLSSLLLDYALYHLVHEPARALALILLGSSYVMHTYQVRPFSNSIEAILVALSLLLLKRMLVVESLKSPTQTGSRYLVLLAFVAACGLFTRITFAAFFLPIALEALKYTLRRSRFALLPWLRSLALPMLVASATGLGFVYADSTYFVFPSRESMFELTPLNFLRYNLLPANLAEHGLHPRWLHLVVNLPMIATPGLLLYVFWSEWDYTNPRTAERPHEKRMDRARAGIMETLQRVLHWVRWSGTTLLSIQPHQEPRFLIPLLTPMIALVLNHGRIMRAGRWFWSVWIVSNVALAILFGMLHQGGVVPSLFRVHDIIYGERTPTFDQRFYVVYWKTYMPPRHLLAIPQAHVDTKAVRVFDVAGAPADGVARALSIPGMIPNSTTLLVAPFHAVRSFDARAQECLTLRNRVFPHLDLDHIAEAVEVGWKDGLSLGIWEVDSVCFERTMPAAA
ncbi:glycosyltransferase family 22 protein [Polyporus arcularius HHB13444]|uniref:Mannosyltransferase n=1 Tax=Polyporus arcularius HHB13444 TaxID=1314778 RepID=A0A5C3NZN5_9APHY|nr:glycosyltransferase family 22 protein [Polyporus arcularius HHB13444]